MTKPSRQPAIRRAKASAAQFRAGESIRVEYDTSEADDALDALVAASLEAVRPAAQAGAQVFYEEARTRCPVSAEAHVFYGRDSLKTGVVYEFQPGNLKDSIYQAFSKDNSSVYGDGYRRATYHIAWNHLQAPYGFMVEFGTSRASAHAFLRPAYDTRAKDALDATRNRYAEEMRSAGVLS